MGKCPHAFAILRVRAEASKARCEVAHADREGNLHHSPSQESDFNATKEGIASFCHQFGVARAIHG